MSLARRHPYLVSGFGSVLTTGVCLGVYLLILALSIAGVERLAGLPDVGHVLRQLTVNARFVPFAIAAYLCWRITSRCPRRIICSLGACLCIALFAVLIHADITKSPDGKSNLVLGMGMSMAITWTVIAQFLVPFVIWGGLMLKSARRVDASMPHLV